VSLARALGDRDVEATSAERGAGDSCVVRIRPERWSSVGYVEQTMPSKQYGS